MHSQKKTVCLMLVFAVAVSGCAHTMAEKNSQSARIFENTNCELDGAPDILPPSDLMARAEMTKESHSHDGCDVCQKSVSKRGARNDKTTQAAQKRRKTILRSASDNIKNFGEGVVYTVAWTSVGAMSLALMPVLLASEMIEYVRDPR
jgi:hypothetical protein